VVDITGFTLGINAVYTEKGQSEPTSHPLSTFEALLGLPSATVALLNTVYLASDLGAGDYVRQPSIDAR
jgi:hypothetical protein